MSSASHIDMHREHITWRKDNDLWRDEVAIWEREINEAIQDLPGLELALRAYAQKLQKHAASIRLYEQDFTTHEQTLAEFERGEIPEELVVQAQEHARESQQHRAQRKAQGLVFAGITDTCGMGLVLAHMPWNQLGTNRQTSCTTNTTSE